MGWWVQDEEGHSFPLVETDPPLVWGDEPADYMDNAIDAIKKTFQVQWDRDPTQQEVRAGLMFTLREALPND